MEGNTQFADDYHVIDSFSEGLAMVMDYKERKKRLYQRKGRRSHFLSSYSADAFSEGLAAVGVDLPKEEGRQSAETRYGYIDKKKEAGSSSRNTEMHLLSGMVSQR